MTIEKILSLTLIENPSYVSLLQEDELNTCQITSCNIDEFAERITPLLGMTTKGVRETFFEYIELDATEFDKLMKNLSAPEGFVPVLLNATVQAHDDYGAVGQYTIKMPIEMANFDYGCTSYRQGKIFIEYIDVIVPHGAFVSFTKISSQAAQIQE